MVIKINEQAYFEALTAISKCEEIELHSLAIEIEQRLRYINLEKQTDAARNLIKKSKNISFEY